MQQLGYSLAAIREFLKYRRQLDESGKRRLCVADLAAARRALQTQLDDVRPHIVRARAEVERGGKLAADLEADIARIGEQLARRHAGSTVARSGREARTLG